MYIDMEDMNDWNISQNELKSLLFGDKSQGIKLANYKDYKAYPLVKWLCCVNVAAVYHLEGRDGLFDDSVLIVYYYYV